MDGDAQVAHGVRVILTPGHTPGGQSVVVNTRAGQVLITGFCCNEVNFPPRGRPFLRGSTSMSSTPMRAPGGSKRMADILIPLHDLAVGRQKKHSQAKGGNIMHFWSKVLAVGAGDSAWRGVSRAL